MKMFYSILILTLFSTILFSTIINVPAEQPTIQAGIDTAVNADTVLVQPGTYVENINYIGKNITVASIFLTTQDTTYISQTVIDGDSLDTVVKFESGEDSTAVLCGFTVTNGYTENGGSGILVNNSNPKLSKLLITENIAEGSMQAYGHGGGIRIINGQNLVLEDLVITNNDADYGGGLYCENSWIELNNVVISENSASFPGQFFENGGSGGGIGIVSSEILISNTIVDGNSSPWGGGIHCEDSNIDIINIELCNNSSDFGGGIYFFQTTANLENIMVSNNSANGNYWGSGRGGGAFCNSSEITVSDGSINSNSSGMGGGVYCIDSEPTISHVLISCNTAYGSDQGMPAGRGGGLYFDNSSPDLQNISVLYNRTNRLGGGIYFNDCFNPYLANVTIAENGAGLHGGGIYCSGSSPQFDAVNRCNIYLNSAGVGCDIYGDECDVIVDTFTVSQPDDFFAFPFDNFTFDVLNAQVGQVTQDIYVSSTGSNSNSGLTASNPLLTIHCALAKVLPDSTNHLSIHISNGVYSSSTNGEMFPLNCRSFVTLLGEGQESTILDGEELGRILYFENDNSSSIINLGIKNGSSRIGAGIYCSNSSINLINTIISDNCASGRHNTGGGIYCYGSELNISDMLMNNNTSSVGAGIYCGNSILSLKNVTSAVNYAYIGSSIYSWASNLYLINCVFWNDTTESITNDDSTIDVIYTDIQGGETGIVTNDNGTVNWLEGNIDLDPLFLGTGDHPFSLIENSPCIDAGTPDTIGLNLPEFDLAGNPRVFGGRIDMGAYEWQGTLIDDNLIPLIAKLNQNYPNPFNPTTTINYSLKERSKVSLNIFNIKGQKVKQLVSEQLSAGQHTVIWNGRDDNGKSVSSGIYFYKLKTDYYEKTRKMILMK